MTILHAAAGMPHIHSDALALIAALAWGAYVVGVVVHKVRR